jgi:hypothetical protein
MSRAARAQNAATIPTVSRAFRRVRLGPLGGGFRFWGLGSIGTSKRKRPPGEVCRGVSCVLVIRDEGEGTLRERTIVEGPL